MIFGGIDPGLLGGLSLMDDSGKLNMSVMMPRLKFKDKKDDIDVCGIKDFFQGCGFISIEYASAMPINVKGNQTQGTASMFNYGRGYGQILGWLRTWGIHHIVVHPTKWKRHFELLKCYKSKSVELAIQKTGNDFIPPGCRTPKDGLAESYLIGEYGRELYIKTNGDPK